MWIYVDVVRCRIILLLLHVMRICLVRDGEGCGCRTMLEHMLSNPGQSRAKRRAAGEAT